LPWANILSPISPIEISGKSVRLPLYCAGGTYIALVALILRWWHLYCAGGTYIALVALILRWLHLYCAGGTYIALVALILRWWHSGKTDYRVALSGILNRLGYNIKEVVAKFSHFVTTVSKYYFLQ
jgi:hypothetical protein